MTTSEIASLYSDIQIRHGLTTRLKLEVLRANHIADMVQAIPETTREGATGAHDTETVAPIAERTVCEVTKPCPVGVVT